jgi:oxaloacetate decarboxylase gamma subunit
MDNIGTGIQLMIVGMTTVFLILLIVIWGGKLLIKAVNQFAPEEVATPKRGSDASTTVDSTTMAVLQQVVSQITGGKGKIASAHRV